MPLVRGRFFGAGAIVQATQVVAAGQRFRINTFIASAQPNSAVLEDPEFAIDDTTGTFAGTFLRGYLTNSDDGVQTGFNIFKGTDLNIITPDGQDVRFIVDNRTAATEVSVYYDGYIF